MALASCPCPSGAAAEFAHDAPGFEVGVGAFAGAARPRATFSSTIREPTRRPRPHRLRQLAGGHHLLTRRHVH